MVSDSDRAAIERFLCIVNNRTHEIYASFPRDERTDWHNAHAIITALNETALQFKLNPANLSGCQRIAPAEE